MYDTTKLIQAIKDDDTTTAEREFADWLISHNSGESNGAVYLVTAIKRLGDNLIKVGRMKEVRQALNFMLLCERELSDKK